MKKSVILLCIIFVLGLSFFVSAEESDLSDKLIIENIGDWVFVEGFFYEDYSVCGRIRAMGTYEVSYLLENVTTLPQEGFISPGLLPYGAGEGTAISLSEVNVNVNRKTLEDYIRCISVSDKKNPYEVMNFNENNLLYKVSSVSTFNISSVFSGQELEELEVEIREYAWYSGKNIIFLKILVAETDDRNYSDATNEMLTAYLDKYPSDFSNGLLQRIFSWFRNLF